MARVELLSEADAPLLARRFYDAGDPGPIVAALANVPELLEVALPFIGAVLSASSIPARAKEIVILRTSAVLNCRYCVNAHTVVARDVGLSIEEVRALRDDLDPHVVFETEPELALLAWIDVVAGSIGPVGEAASDRVRASWADHQVVELTLLIGATMMLNRFCTSLDLPTSPDTWGRLGAEGLL